jgi:DNA-binding NtrC family response regulator
VLTVEDCEDDAKLELLALQDAGLCVHCCWARDAAEIAAALAREGWDLVRSEHHLPHLHRFEAPRVLRESAAHIPLILMSGTIVEEAVVVSIREGAADYLRSTTSAASASL